MCLLLISTFLKVYPKSGVIATHTLLALWNHHELTNSTMERPAKKQKIARQLVELNQDVLDHALSYLETDDLCNLSLVSHDFRLKLLHFMFAKVKVSWGNLIYLQTKRTSFKSTEYVRSVRITVPDSYNEYKQVNYAFEELISTKVFPNLVEVSVNSQSLSYWLKYNKCSQIRDLTLYCDNWFRGVKIFQLSHVDNFDNLRLLCLHKYHFNWSKEDVKPKIGLTKLLLHDCTWEYPFDLVHFNLDDTLRDLTITYSNNNPFTILERFLSFLKDPFAGHSESLRSVKMQIVDVTHNKLHKNLLSLTVFDKFLESFSGIEHLHFWGWTTNLNYIREVLLRQNFEYPVFVTLKVESLDKSDVNRYLNSMASIHNLRLKVTLV